MNNKSRYSNRLVKRGGQLLTVGGMFLLLGAGSLQPRIAALRSQSGLYVPDAHYQFDAQEMAAQGKTLSHTFTLYNGRGQPLRVKASANCGCTGLSWNNTILPPFGRESITASMDSSKRSQSVGITFNLGKGDYFFASLKQNSS